MPQIKEALENKKDSLLSIKKPQKSRRIRELTRLGHLGLASLGDQAVKELMAPLTTQFPRRSERSRKPNSNVKKRESKRKTIHKVIPSESPETSNTETFECFTCNTIFFCEEDVFFAHLDDCPGLGELSEGCIWNDSASTLASLDTSRTEVIQSQQKCDPEEDVDVDQVANSFGLPQFTAVDLNKYLKSHEISFSPETLELISLPTTVSAIQPNSTNSIEPQNLPLNENGPLKSISGNEEKVSLLKENSDISLTEALEKINELENYIGTLKEKINTLQTNSFKDHEVSSRCLICLDSFRDPLVSTECWHVHCRECWFHTLAVKKLCPECQRITFPEELRRIYL